MNPHPKTIEYIRAACQRPGIYMGDFDLRQLEMQLHGFDAALAAVGELGAHGRFNRDFTNFVSRGSRSQRIARLGRCACARLRLWKAGI